MAIKIILSSAAMGDVDELDFGCWARYVAERIDEATGVEVAEVDQQRFGEAGEDQISGATEEQRETLRRWLSVDGWDAFCGQGGPWEKMRAEAEAAAAV
jgi:hypothetical protein